MSDPTPIGEQEKKQIVCVTCGKSFDFDQTYEGRCFRDHVAYSDRERDKLDALRRNSSGGGGNVTVTGPTIAMSNQQTAQQQAVSYAPAPYIVAAKRRGCWARYSCRSKLIFLVCLVGVAFAITYTVLYGHKFKGHGHDKTMNQTTTTQVPTSMPSL